MRDGKSPLALNRSSWIFNHCFIFKTITIKKSKSSCKPGSNRCKGRQSDSGAVARIYSCSWWHGTVAHSSVRLWKHKAVLEWFCGRAATMNVMCGCLIRSCDPHCKHVSTVVSMFSNGPAEQLLSHFHLGLWQDGPSPRVKRNNSPCAVIMMGDWILTGSLLPVTSN